MSVVSVFANQLIFDLDGTQVECQVTNWSIDRTSISSNPLRTACPDGSVDIPDPNADGVGTLTVEGLADWSDTGWTFLLAGKERAVVPFTLNADTDIPAQARTFTGTLRVPYHKWDWGPVGEVQTVSLEFTLQDYTGPTRYVP